LLSGKQVGRESYIERKATSERINYSPGSTFTLGQGGISPSLEALYNCSLSIKKPSFSFKMRSKQRIYLTAFHRQKLSLGEYRTELQYSAFHWAIIVRSKRHRFGGKRISSAFDATDAITTDSNRTMQQSSEPEWQFRAREDFDADGDPRLLIMALIGKLPQQLSHEQLKELLKTIPLTIDGSEPKQNCVTWATLAVQKLQTDGLCEQFDIGDTINSIVEFAEAPQSISVILSGRHSCIAVHHPTDSFSPHHPQSVSKFDSRSVVSSLKINYLSKFNGWRRGWQRDPSTSSFRHCYRASMATSQRDR
jgi:hypothetical protein